MYKSIKYSVFVSAFFGCLLAQSSIDRAEYDEALIVSSQSNAQQSNSSRTNNGFGSPFREVVLPSTSSSRESANDMVDEENLGNIGVEENSSTSVTAGILTSTAPAETDSSSRQRLSLRERVRQQRLMSMRYEILRRLGFQNPPIMNTQNGASQIDRLHEGPFPTATPPEERRCYVADRATPEATQASLWHDTSHLGIRLHIGLPRLRRRDRNNKEVWSGRLKLFLKPNPECPCYGIDNGMSRLLVTAYQFIRPLTLRKRNRVVYRRRLLDAVMVPGEGNLWVGLDIKLAVSTWIGRPRRNFGLEVTVKDVNETQINATHLFVFPESEDVGRERTCRDDNGEAVEQLPWTPARLQPSTVAANKPYVDVILLNRELAQHYPQQYQYQQYNPYHALGRLQQRQQRNINS